MVVFKIDVYSHYVKVTGFAKQSKEILTEFVRLNLTLMGYVRVRGRNVYKPVRAFCTRTADHNEYRFHINNLDALLTHFRRNLCSDHNLDITYHEPPAGVAVKLELNGKRTPYDYQLPAIDYLSRIPTKGESRSKLVNIQTGKGKGIIAITALSRLGMRTLVVLKPMFIEKWIDELNDNLVLSKRDIMVVRGGSDLKAVLKLGLEGSLEAKIIIISNRTLYFFLEDYRTFNGANDLYPCKPDEMMSVLGIGVKLIDETHMEFHFNFILDLYTNVLTTIDLSATMDSDDRFINKMYDLRFPLDTRYGGLTYDKYVSCAGLYYNTSDETLRKLSYIRRGMRSYSHVDFEKSLLHHKKILHRYFGFIYDVIDGEFLPDWESGQKMIVFAATIQLCTLLADELRKRYPNKRIGRYVDEDNFSELYDNDIIVSTVLSSGTAVDIPGLRVVLLTTALGSRTSNLQALGRLRKLPERWSHVPLKFFYFVNEAITHHHAYAQRKKESFKDKVIAHADIYLKGVL